MKFFTHKLLIIRFYHYFFQELITTLYIGFLCLIFASYLVYLFEFNAFKHPSLFSGGSQLPSHHSPGELPINLAQRSATPLPPDTPTNRCVCTAGDGGVWETSQTSRMSEGKIGGAREGDKSGQTTAFANYADALWWGIVSI